MTHFENDFLQQYAVLWPLNGYDRHGDPIRGTAEEIRCRWEQDDSEALGAKEEPIGMPVTVFVNQEITIGSTLWLGRLTDTTPGTADLEDLFIVLSYAGIPDVKGRTFQRTVTAMRQ
jgi:hypothetical protein